MIRLNGVTRYYKNRAGQTPVLRDIQLDVPQGAFVSITGPSGSGKSTLLQVVGLLDHDWQGEYWFDGQALHGMSPKARQGFARDQIGFIFQQYHLLDDLTLAENLELPLNYRNLPSKERRQKVDTMLERFGFAHRRDDYPGQLSGGQQQMLAVARALIAEPKVLLADEPTGALHSEQGRMIMELLKSLNEQGCTILQVTHHDSFAAYGNPCYRMLDGVLSRA